MDNKEFGKWLEERTRRFALSIIRLSVILPETSEGKVVRFQLTKSGSSVGANYREANRSRSRADFANKIKICESECSECAYWLEILEDMKWVSDKVLSPLLAEANEILAIFTKIAHSSKS